MKTFPLRIGTPDGLLFEGEAVRVVCRGITGDFAILAGHSNYCTALGMGEAIGDGDYSEIKNFYRYKVCDSIIELDINERLKKESFVGPIIDGVRFKQKIDDLKRPKSAI